MGPLEKRAWTLAKIAFYGALAACSSSSSGVAGDAGEETSLEDAGGAPALDDTSGDATGAALDDASGDAATDDASGDATLDAGGDAATDAAEAGRDASASGSDAGADSAAADGGPASDGSTGGTGDAATDASRDAGGSLGSGAVCDTSHDECGAGLKCCYSPGLPLDGAPKQSTCMIDTCTRFPP